MRGRDYAEGDAVWLPLLATPEEWAYAAGFVDGEGSLCISRHKGNRTNDHAVYRPVFVVTNCNRAVLDELRSLFQQGHIRERPRINEKWKVCYTLTIDSLKMIPVLERLLPFLRVKKRQCELLLRFARGRAQHRTTPLVQEELDLIAEVRSVNDRSFTRGVTPIELPKPRPRVYMTKKRREAGAAGVMDAKGTAA